MTAEHSETGEATRLELLIHGYRQLGKIVRSRVFSRFLVLLAHPNHARRVLQERVNNSNKQTPGFAVLLDLLRDELLTSKGEHWLRQRRFAHLHFINSELRSPGTR